MPSGVIMHRQSSFEHIGQQCTHLEQVIFDNTQHNDTPKRHRYGDSGGPGGGAAEKQCPQYHFNIFKQQQHRPRPPNRFFSLVSLSAEGCESGLMPITEVFEKLSSVENVLGTTQKTSLLFCMHPIVIKTCVLMCPLFFYWAWYHIVLFNKFTTR